MNLYIMALLFTACTNNSSEKEVEVDRKDESQIEVDGDNHGVTAATDCNDDDPQSTTVEDDADCDGVLTADDCNDDD